MIQKALIDLVQTGDGGCTQLSDFLADNPRKLRIADIVLALDGAVLPVLRVRLY